MSKKLETGSESTKWSAEQWRAWLTKRLERRLATFRNEPEEMIGAFERERANIDSYRGREILELVQNADDAGVGYGHNAVLVRWWPEGVCVANTGVPFSAAGVDSLIVSNVSPKKLDRSRYIGNRGLGFRSVLAWTGCPFVLSGTLRLGFSSSLAAASLKGLTEENEPVRQKVDEWKRSGHEVPIPVLSCPALIASDDLPEFAKGQAWRLMWERARDLRKRYDTVVALPFTEPRAAEQALKQLEGLEAELVLFLQYVQQITIETPDTTTVWGAVRQQESVTITPESDGSQPALWKIFRRTGLIPEDLLTPGQRGTSAFEIRIGVREGAIGPHFLYSYFPTRVRFPYPVVAHATMELTPNRQNLVETEANRYLAEKLAEAMAEVAEQSVGPDRPWCALKLVASEALSLDPVLEALGFRHALLEAARSKKIIPRRDGTFVSSVSVQRLPVDTESWLPLRQFEDVVLPTDEYRLGNALEWLQVGELSAEQFRERVEKVSPSLTLDERAALAAGMARHRKHEFVPKDPPPALLIDGSGAALDPATVAYFPPLSRVPFDLPAWMAIKLVSGRFVEKMAEILRYSQRRLAEELREAGYKSVHEYDFRGVARAIVAQTASRCRDDPERSDKIRLEGIMALRNLWRSAGAQEAAQREPALQVDLPARQKDWRKAEDLYLGTPYAKGVLMEALFGGLHPELFVAGPDVFGVTDDDENWQGFLLWLGVAAIPRKGTISCYSWSDAGYLEHVRREAKYPMEFGEFPVPSPDRLDLRSAKVTSIEHIQEIVDHADPHAILAWLAVDDRLKTWLRQGDPEARLEACFRVQTYRTASHPAPSYVAWLLHNRGWLPTTSGDKHRPVECVLVKSVSDEIQRIFPRPAVNPKAEVFEKLQIDEEILAQVLVSVGVRMSLEHLSWEQCYDVMLRLPEIDAEGKAASRMYRLVAEKREDEGPTLAAQMRQEEFQQKGKLWACTIGEWSYVTVAEGVYFAGDATIPKAIVDQFAVIDLPRRRSLEKIARVFGVKVLRTRDIEISINRFDGIPNGDLLNDELQRLKPYVLAVRLDATPDVAGLAQFKRLRIVPCSRVYGSARVNDHDIAISLASPGESLVVEDKAYLVVRPTVSGPFLQDAIVARHAANILAEVLDVERASDFAQLALAKGHAVRKGVLSDILGHDAEEILAHARDGLQTGIEEELEPHPAWGFLTVEPTESETTRADIGVASEDQRTPAAEERTEAPVPGQVEAETVEQEPAGPRHAIERRRVTAKRSTGAGVTRMPRVADGDRCEELVERFEESQGRFPLRVSTLQGTEGFGCDIVSFSTRQDRKTFIGINGKDVALVKRFIEVKGRSTQKGTIPLKGNQLEGARRHRERYYLYRVYEAVPGQEWEVVQLADPVDHDWEVSYEVDPFRCHATKYWTVKAVESNTQDGGQ